jgi:hypothetical protein
VQVSSWNIISAAEQAHRGQRHLFFCDQQSLYVRLRVRRIRKTVKCLMVADL